MSFGNEADLDSIVNKIKEDIHIKNEFDRD